MQPEEKIVSDHNISEHQKALAVRIAEVSTSEEKVALSKWIERLLEIRESNIPSIQKAKQAIAVTQESDVILPTIKMIGREIKKYGWDERGLPGRLFIGGALVGGAIFGGQGAGIAALGTAIGVPLWVVFGTGGAFIGVAYEELTGEKLDRKTSFRVIDAEEESEK